MTIVTAEQLLEQAWDENADPFTNAVRVAVMTLRRKLGEPPIVHTLPRVGYRFGDPRLMHLSPRHRLVIAMLLSWPIGLRVLRIGP